DLGSSLSGSIALFYDVELTTANISGQCGVYLDANQDDDSLGNFMTHDNPWDDDLSSSIPRASFEFEDYESVNPTLAVERFGAGIDCADDKFTVFAAYDNERQMVRSTIHEKTSGNLVWDSGFHPVDSNYNPDSLRFEMRDDISGSDFSFNSTTDIATMTSSDPTYELTVDVNNVMVIHSVTTYKGYGPTPADEATEIDVNDDLSWFEGATAATQDVYFGTSWADVNQDSTPNSTQTTTSYEPGTLSEDTDYYWRVDQNDGSTTRTGDIWHFVTGAGGYTAGVINPDDLERYGKSTVWSPTEAGEGWALVSNVNEAHIETSNGVDSSKCLRSIGDDAVNPQVRWYGSAAASGTKTLSFDILMDDGGWTSGAARVFPYFGSAGNGENWLVFQRSGATLDMSVAARTSGYDLTEVNLPGKLTDPNDYLDIWYTFEMEFDYSASTVRARFAPTGSAFNAWSDTVTMEHTDAISSVFFNALNGNILIDNISLAAGPPDVNIVGSWTSGSSHTAESGDNRLLIVTVNTEDDGDTLDMNSVTYGGRTLTEVVDYSYATTNTAYVGIFYLDDANLDLASGSTISLDWTTGPSKTPSISSVFLENVDQSNPITDSNSGGGTTSTITGGSLATSSGDMVLASATSGENGGDYTMNNSFTEDLEFAPDSADAVCGHKDATGSNETPSVTAAGTFYRQAVAGVVVNKND
ncbi:hypothetical protein ACFL3G_12150, partial [Planctomycetota bacterium]